MAITIRGKSGLDREEITNPKSLVVRVRNPWALESGTYPICWASNLTRVLVSADTSGSSRKAFETVITETPARAAMSFRRTIENKKFDPVAGQYSTFSIQYLVFAVSTMPFYTGS